MGDRAEADYAALFGGKAKSAIPASGKVAHNSTPPPTPYRDRIPVPLRLEPELVEQLDAWCRDNEYTRAQIIRRLIRLHLEAQG